MTCEAGDTMTTIWHDDGGRWRALAPTGFPNEAALHDLVAEAPDLLPLSGGPRLAVVGREVQLPSGYADLLAVELSGRLVVIEVKLAANAEARRAVIAQTLGYAAALQGVTVEELEGEILATPLRRLGFSDLAEAVRASDQERQVDAEEFRSALADSLSSGAFRLVLVLDEAPDELVRIAGYLERMTEGLLLDLVTVSAFEVGGARILVPQRIDPQRSSPPEHESQRVTSPRDAIPVEGSDAFAERIAAYPPNVQPAHRRLLEWARRLEEQGVARLWSTVGRTQDVLQVRVRGDQVGLVTVWAGQAGPAMSVWPTVFERRAPRALVEIERLVGSDSLTKSLRDIGDDLLAALGQGYREAAGQ